MPDPNECICGHVRDEHEAGQNCTVPECKCIYFEVDHNAED